MINDDPQDQQERGDRENASRDELPVPRKDLTWDAVIEKASAPQVGHGPQQSPAAQNATIWLKAAAPVIILLLYLGIKFFGGSHVRYGDAWKSPAVTETISGVDPTGEETRLDAATRQFLGEVETLQASNRWQEIIRRVAAQPPAIRNHPVVRAMDAIAHVRSGDRSVQLERRIIDLSGELAPSQKRYPDLINELNYVRAELIASRSGTPEILNRNTDLLFRFLGPDANSAYNVDVRIDTAQTFESVADRMVQNATGMIRSDVVQLREARTMYQTGLRFLVKPDGWMQLDPVSPRARPVIDRFIGKMRQVNRSINGPTIPLTDSDSETWSGRRNAPVHDPGPAR